jgi:hypothetical protein
MAGQFGALRCWARPRPFGERHQKSRKGEDLAKRPHLVLQEMVLGFAEPPERVRRILIAMLERLPQYLFLFYQLLLTKRRTQEHLQLMPPPPLCRQSAFAPIRNPSDLVQITLLGKLEKLLILRCGSNSLLVEETMLGR